VTRQGQDLRGQDPAVRRDHEQVAAGGPQRGLHRRVPQGLRLVHREAQFDRRLLHRGLGHSSPRPLGLSARVTTRGTGYPASTRRRSDGTANPAEPMKTIRVSDGSNPHLHAHARRFLHPPRQGKEQFPQQRPLRPLRFSGVGTGTRTSRAKKPGARDRENLLFRIVSGARFARAFEGVSGSCHRNSPKPRTRPEAASPGWPGGPVPGPCPGPVLVLSCPVLKSHSVFAPLREIRPPVPVPVSPPLAPWSEMFRRGRGRRAPTGQGPASSRRSFSKSRRASGG